MHLQKTLTTIIKLVMKAKTEKSMVNSPIIPKVIFLSYFCHIAVILLYRIKVERYSAARHDRFFYTILKYTSLSVHRTRRRVKIIKKTIKLDPRTHSYKMQKQERSVFKLHYKGLHHVPEQQY